MLSSASARAVTLNVAYSYTDINSALWNGTGTLSYDGSGNNQSFQITELSFIESSGSISNTYSLDADFASSNIDINNAGQVVSFNLFGINVLGSGIDYRRLISGETGSEASTVLRINEDFSEIEDYSASTNFSPAVAVPWDFSQDKEYC